MTWLINALKDESNFGGVVAQVKTRPPTCVDDAARETGGRTGAIKNRSLPEAAGMQSRSRTRARQRRFRQRLQPARHPCKCHPAGHCGGGCDGYLGGVATAGVGGLWARLNIVRVSVHRLDINAVLVVAEDHRGIVALLLHPVNIPLGAPENLHRAKERCAVDADQRPLGGGEGQEDCQKLGQG